MLQDKTSAGINADKLKALDKRTQDGGTEVKRYDKYFMKTDFWNSSGGGGGSPPPPPGKIPQDSCESSMTLAPPYQKSKATPPS